MNVPSDRPILLNPGPVTLTDRVRNALSSVDLCHREPEFAALMIEIKDRLLHVYPESRTDHAAVVLSGSGTLAVEAMLQSLLPGDGKTLTLANGVYGERIHDMITTSGKRSIMVKAGWPEPMDLAEAERLLAGDPDITHVAAVHNETTTGRLNDLDALGRLCRRYDKPLLLDAVSSFGGERIEFSDWNLAALATTANKCLHAAPGLCCVIARRDLLEDGSVRDESPAGSIYLDLFRYHQAQKKGFSPYTMTTHAAVALREALCELQESGGWQARHARYRELSARLRRDLDALGMSRFLPEDDYCSMISSFYLPRGYDYESLHDELKQAGFVIYAGQGGLFHAIFRIANMGAISDADADRLVGIFRRLAASGSAAGEGR
jgi:2-aminoethylphosphonate-pyruvate transaminase